MFVNFKRILKSGWQNFKRDGEIAFATISILFLSIFLVSSIFFLKDVSQFLINQIKEKVDVSIYFKEDLPEEEILKVKEEILKIPEIKKIEYVSKELALQNFMEKHKDEPIIMEALKEVGKNPFLASLNIKALESAQYEKVVQFLENSPFGNLIEKIDYYQRKPIIERLFSLTSFFQKTAISLSILLILIAILVCFNTIRLAILNSSEEIKIQRMVGASNWFIRGPFLVQGAISGIISAFFSLLVFFLSLWFLNPRFGGLFPGLNLFALFLANLKFLIPLQFLTGISLGVISSLIAIRKYLRI